MMSTKNWEHFLRKNALVLDSQQGAITIALLLGALWRACWVVMGEY